MSFDCTFYNFKYKAHIFISCWWTVPLQPAWWSTLKLCYCSSLLLQWCHYLFNMLWEWAQADQGTLALTRGVNFAHWNKWIKLFFKAEPTNIARANYVSIRSASKFSSLCFSFNWPLYSNIEYKQPLLFKFKRIELEIFSLHFCTDLA